MTSEPKLAYDPPILVSLEPGNNLQTAVPSAHVRLARAQESHFLSIRMSQGGLLKEHLEPCPRGAAAAAAGGGGPEFESPRPRLGWGGEVCLRHGGGGALPVHMAERHIYKDSAKQG